MRRKVVFRLAVLGVVAVLFASPVVADERIIVRAIEQLILDVTSIKNENRMLREEVEMLKVQIKKMQNPKIGQLEQSPEKQPVSEALSSQTPGHSLSGFWKGVKKFLTTPPANHNSSTKHDGRTINDDGWNGGWDEVSAPQTLVVAESSTTEIFDPVPLVEIDEQKPAGECRDEKEFETFSGDQSGDSNQGCAG